MQKEYDVKVEWRPFELHPELPPEGLATGEMSKGKDPEKSRLSKQYLEQTAKDAGLDFKQRQRASNTRLALEAAEFARTQGEEAFEKFHRALFIAYFSEGRDIGDAAVLADLGASVGLDKELMSAALSGRVFWDLVQAHINVVKKAQIYAVPTFIFDGRFMVQGAQPYPVFKRVMEEHVLPAARGESPLQRPPPAS